MNLLADVITYVRRIVKSATDAELSDALIIDYINRFWLMDVNARIQLFDFKTRYQFQTTPGIDRYNMPVYSVQTEPGNQPIASFPVYQGFMAPCTAIGIDIPFYTVRSAFLNLWPAYIQQLIPATTGDGTSGPYTLSLPFFPALAGHVDMSGIITSGIQQDPPVVSTFNTLIPSTSVYPGVWITATDATGANVVVCDSGQFLQGNVGYGLLMQKGNAPFGNAALPGGYSTVSNTVNYASGSVTVTFPVAIPAGSNINAQCYFIEQGMPRAILFENNTITVRPPPNTQYLVELEAYLTPAAFLNTGAAIPFAYMAEYIARGAARKMLSDTGDWEQFDRYEGLFLEQERLVWKRSQRQFTSTRTPTIYSGEQNQSGFNGSNIGAT